jgi:DNA segregation ATPase FtsK/SpoIIIE, S-DNA-T family
MAKAIVEDKVGLRKPTPDKQILLSILNAIVSLIILVALVTYEPGTYHASPSVGSTPLLGQFGIFTARTLLGIFGLSAWLLPWFFGTCTFLLSRKILSKERLTKLATIFLSILSISVLANIRDAQLLENGQDVLLNSNVYEHGAGGSIGAILYSGMPITSNPDQQIGGILKVWLGSLGTTVISMGILLFALTHHFSLTPINFLLSFCLSFKRKSGSNSVIDESEDETPQKSLKAKETAVIEKDKKRSKWNLPWKVKEEGDDLLFGDVSKGASAQPKPILPAVKPKKINTESTPNAENEDSSVISKSADEIRDDPISKPEEMPIIKDTFDSSEDEINSSDGMEGFKVVRAAKTEKAGDLFPERKGDYHFPPMSLLMEPPEEEAIGDEDHILKAKRLQDTLKEFKIEVEMGEVHTGPVITRYDLHPAPGVRVEKIANLDKNLAMALKAESVRILAPVPGKGCVGIEVPNAVPMPVCMKEILQSKAWHEAGAEIPIVLGKEASGKPLVADLTKMPHLLVAGSTGSGKTVCINAIIASLCYHSSPEDVRFIMVDPKIVEMKVYNDLPHMLIPVVTDPKKVPGALKWLLIEMERRYQIFSKIGVRNVAGFNAKILKDKAEKEKAMLLDAEMTPEERAALNSIEVPRDDDALEVPENKLPYIVCIIDELADLMMVAQADVETGIARLAQLARAAGIHLIIATQRPSVNVITGVIKANLPSRISFRVASYRDSQTILDGKGAEALIGKGDMLFIPPGSSTFARAQGAFVSDDEINGIVDFLKINGPPQIIEEVRDQIESAGEDDVLGNDDSDDDPMTRKAIEIIRSTKRASTSNLQRKLSIGYNRAARIMDDLEDRGLVGPDVAGQGREILMDL